MDLAKYMTDSIYDIMAKAYLNVLSNPRQARFIHRMQRQFSASSQRRTKLLEEDGIEVPPFLIASIATTCNLQCKGCYARKNGIAAPDNQPRRQTLAPDQWRTIFDEAADLGVNFALIAGGEPLTRRDLLEQIAQVENMIFPVFTNGTMVGASYMEFFKQHMNMIPVFSLEGDAMQTDNRRGQGVYRLVEQSMQKMKEAKLFYGASITVTTENFRAVTDMDYVRQLRDKGCKLVFYVEYVPIDETTAHLAFADEHVAEMEQRLQQLRNEVEGIILLSFPGDEKALGGCLAAGRGFFHIGPDGAAEPCPFSPYSDSNVLQTGLRGALQSPLFRRIRDARALGWEHTGGCTLFEHKEEVEAMLQKND